MSSIKFNIENLITEIQTNRVKLYEIVDKASEIRTKTDQLLPTNVDYKSRWVIPERMKAISQILDSELKIRQAIDSSIVTESKLNIELEKLGGGEKEEIKNIANLFAQSIK